MKIDIETVTSELKLDRSNWVLTTFGEIAIQQKESVDRENTDITRYVKGEHMYSEDLHLREWGELEDEYLGPAFIRKFEEGDILYGSRRTYLRKVCIAPFTGITANTTFVIKAKEDLIDKRLLPFVMLSEGFSEHSIRNSKGSVNPYVNWKDLAGYEFLLPPQDQQTQLAELLWAMDTAIEREKKVLLTNIALMDAFIREEISSIFHMNGQEYYKLDEVCEIKGRVGWKGYKKTDLRKSGPIVIGAKDIDSFNRLSLTAPTFLSREKYEESPYIMVSKGDILIVQRGNTIGKMVHILEDIGEVTIKPSMVLMKNIEIDDSYLFAVLISPYIKKTVESISSTTAIPMITQGDIKGFKIPKLSTHKINSLGAKVSKIRTFIEKIESKLRKSKNLQKSLINQVF